MLNKSIFFNFTLGFVLVAFSGCGDTTEFASNKPVVSSGQGDIKPDILVPDVPSNPIIPALPDECVDGIVQVHLLSNAIYSSASNTSWDYQSEKVIRYEISLECQGERVGLQNLSIAFDLNAQITPFASDIETRIVDSSRNIISSNTMASVSGSDLFGNFGSFAHWKSNNIDIETNSTSVIIELDLSPFDISLPEHNTLDPSFNPSGQTYEIETFIRIEDVVSGVVKLPFIYN